jgi:hypothetical protein
MHRVSTALAAGSAVTTPTCWVPSYLQGDALMFWSIHPDGKKEDLLSEHQVRGGSRWAGGAVVSFVHDLLGQGAAAAATRCVYGCCSASSSPPPGQGLGACR